MPFVVSKGGTFGTVHRFYRSLTTNEPMVIIRWGPLRWLSPFPANECRVMPHCMCEADARAEADRWLEGLEGPPEKAAL